MDIAIAILLTALSLGCWFASALGLPGNWGQCLLAAAAWAFLPEEYRSWIGWPIVVTTLVLAAIGELIELALGMVTAGRVGGSKQGMALAFIGSLIGGVVGLVSGSAIPVIGNVIASIVGSGIGAFLGALIGERAAGKEWQESSDVASAAFIGRVLGTVLKTAVGAISATTLIVASWA